MINGLAVKRERKMRNRKGRERELGEEKEGKSDGNKKKKNVG